MSACPNVGSRVWLTKIRYWTRYGTALRRRGSFQSLAPLDTSPQKLVETRSHRGSELLRKVVFPVRFLAPQPFWPDIESDGTMEPATCPMTLAPFGVSLQTSL